MATATKAAKPDLGFHVKDLRGLSRDAKDYLRRHPEEARKTVADALEAAATDKPETFKLESCGKILELPVALKPLIDVRPHGPEILTTAEAAARLEVSKKTVQDWVEKRIMIGWKWRKRGLAIPEEQILGPGKVMPGLQQIIPLLQDDPPLTWIFLQEEWPFGYDAMRPIDKLKEGKVEEVVLAAPAFFGGDFV